MTQDVRHTLEKIIAYCDDQSRHAEQAEALNTSAMPPAAVTGMKMAFSRVLEHARTLLTEHESNAA